MKQRYRLKDGGRCIDRHKPLRFTFEGRELRGFDGDTLASALLANGVRIVGRSFKYRRPRGVFSAGVEEIGALVTLGAGARLDATMRATTAELYDGLTARAERGWPSAAFDVGAAMGWFSRLLPAGFYYKTFMWPPQLWMSYEKIIRRAASDAPSPKEPDADSYIHRHAHCDVLVAGGGAAGLAAARAAANAGARVVIADERPQMGGTLWDEDSEVDGQPGELWAADVAAELAQMENVTILNRATVCGYYDHNYLTIAERLHDHLPFDSRRGARIRLWKVRAKKVIVAAGCHERPLVFAENDSPRVMLAGAVRAYIRRYGVLPARSILFFVNNDYAYEAALAAAAAGARVEIADVRENSEGFWWRRAAERGITVHAAHAVAGLKNAGDNHIVHIAPLTADGGDLAGNARALAFDMVATSGGYTPAAHLFSQSQGALRWSERLAAFVPDKASAVNDCTAVGAAAGALSLRECLKGGHLAGLAAANAASDSPPPPDAEADPSFSPPRYLPFVPTIHPPGEGPAKQFVDMMNDVTIADIHLANREGYEAVEHMKRYTAAGFGVDQGKTGNINALLALADARGKNPADIGHTTYRPPYTALPFGAIAGAARREAFLQERTTPMHEWHCEQGAVFEDVGDWRRARFYPRGGEDMHAAVARECRAARQGAAMLDASTLGKIDIRGRDAAKFLDIIYANTFSTLRVGRCRYGLMLNEHGMIFDDGVTARLNDNHFHMTTTTGGAARVLGWLEEWLQTEWPTLQVHCTSVTEQWAVCSLAGPKSRDIIAALTDMPLDEKSLPFMAWREGQVAGAPARVFRVSFSGALGYEINVPARFGLAVWRRLMEAGEKFGGITPYGTEAMHVLRAEAGFLIAGQDTDGTATPDDMGFGAMTAKKKTDFLGRRSHARADIRRADRKQFVGLLSEPAEKVAPEGCYLTQDQNITPPAPSEGHVTSSYFSANLGRAVALAMVARGRARMGETLWAVTPSGEKIQMKITAPNFLAEEKN